MSILKVLIVMLLSGQITQSQSTLVGPQHGHDGWRVDKDGKLDYVIKLTPETWNMLMNGQQEASFEIPEYVLAFMSKVTVQVGTTPVDRQPSIEELQLKFREQSTTSGPQLSMSGADPRALENRLAQIDRDPSSTTPVRPVNQNTLSNGGSISMPSTTLTTPTTSAPPSSFSTPPAFSTPSAPLTTSNPALGGRATSTQNPNQPLYPQLQPTDRLAASQSSLTFGDPPSIGANSGFTNTRTPQYPSTTTNPATQYQTPSTGVLATQSGQDGFTPIGPSTYTSANQYATNAFDRFGNAATTPTYPNAFNGAQTNTYGNYGAQTVANQLPYANQPVPDYRVSDASAAASNANLVSTRLQNEVDRLTNLYNGEQQRMLALTADYNKKLEEESKKAQEAIVGAKLETRNELFWFRILAMILFVVCVFLVYWLQRLYYSYRNLQANSRSSYNLSL